MGDLLVVSGQLQNVNCHCVAVLLSCLCLVAVVATPGTVPLLQLAVEVPLVVPRIWFWSKWDLRGGSYRVKLSQDCPGSKCAMPPVLALPPSLVSIFVSPSASWP